MEIRIQSIHFDATATLKDFIQKKVGKLTQYYDGILEAEVILKVVKPETVLNKEAQLKIKVAHTELFASKVCDSFEQSIDETVEALEKQLLKFKEKQNPK
jgi:putative sigma-54 modulation protein